MEADIQIPTQFVSSLQKISHNNYIIQNHKYPNGERHSAKMSIILPSGEQRLITFVLPKNCCSVQDLLEQIGVPFNENTDIECIEKHGANTEFVVTVGPSESKEMIQHQDSEQRQGAQKDFGTVERSIRKAVRERKNVQKLQISKAGQGKSGIQEGRKAVYNKVLKKNMTSASVQKISHNNYVIQTQHVNENRNIQQVKYDTAKDNNTAKMTVILPSGEQRLITFTLPSQSCTIHDLLEQIGEPFDDNTPIECVKKSNGETMEFVITVGSSVQKSSSTISNVNAFKRKRTYSKKKVDQPKALPQQHHLRIACRKFCIH